LKLLYYINLHLRFNWDLNLRFVEPSPVYKMQLLINGTCLGSLRGFYIQVWLYSQEKYSDTLIKFCVLYLIYGSSVFVFDCLKSWVFFLFTFILNCHLRGHRGRDGIIQLLMQSLPITTNFVSSNPAHGEVYSIHQYVIKFVSNLWQVSDFSPGTPVSSTNKTTHHDITEILLKVTLNTITP